jgi:hypothetical protein
VHAELQPLDVHREVGRPAPERCRRAARALGEEVADPLAPGDHVQQPDHRRRVAPLEAEADLPLGENPLLEALYGERDGGPH